MKRQTSYKNRALYLVLGVMLCSTSLLTACSDDDDDDNNDVAGGNSTTSIQAGIFTTADGAQYRLTQLGTFTFYYDASGNLTRINSFEVTSNPFRIIAKTPNETLDATCYFNDQGYVSTIKYNSEEIETYYSGKYSGTTTITYNSSGQLSKISLNESGTETEDGVTYKLSSSGEATYTYTNGKLVSCKEVTKESGGVSSTETDIWTFTYGNDKNVYGQYTEGVLDAWEWGYVDKFLAFMGYLGKASAYLPVQMSVICTGEYNGEAFEDYDTYTFSYTLNSNSLVATEFSNQEYDAVNYTYTTLTKAIEDLQPQENSVAETTSNSQHRRAWNRRRRIHI